MFARVRAKVESGKSRSGASSGSLVRTGRAGASHADWIFEAIQELKDEEGVERLGVWLEESGGAESSEAEPVVFHGEMWDQGIASGVAGWTRLACDAPLPIYMLSSGMSCEYELEGTKSEPILGPLVGLSSVLWVPVLGRRILRGLMMVGTRQKQKAMPRLKAERIAEELGLLLELEEERRVAAGRKADLEFWQRMERLMSEEQSASRILGQLAESCTRGNQLGGAGAVFALIGERKNGQAEAVPSQANCEEQLVIRAQSGDAAWAHGVNDGPLETLWRQAIENRRVSGGEAKRLPLAKDIARIVWPFLWRWEKKSRARCWRGCRGKEPRWRRWRE